jgi:hypothetical protein
MEMRKCKNENLIDDYLTNRLVEEKREEFENHYFNCTPCFKKLEERNELISVVKAKGDSIFKNLGEEKSSHSTFLERFFSYLTPKQWAVAAVSACALLVITLGVVPNLKSPVPEFMIDNQVVRGGSLSLISPVIDIQTIPSEFKWDNLGEGVEYKISIYSGELIWEATTESNSISLPEDVKERMKAGERYSWEVKAFSKEGSLIAVSSRVQFTIDSHQ